PQFFQTSRSGPNEFQTQPSTAAFARLPAVFLPGRSRSSSFFRLALRQSHSLSPIFHRAPPPTPETETANPANVTPQCSPSRHRTAASPSAPARAVSSHPTSQNQAPHHAAPPSHA